MSRRNYPRTVREAVLAAYAAGAPLRSICDEHGLNVKTINRWVSKSDTVTPRPPGRPRMPDTDDPAGKKRVAKRQQYANRQARLRAAAAEQTRKRTATQAAAKAGAR